MQLLDKKQINFKISRLAIEIIEHHVNHEEVVLIGINKNGLQTAERLKVAIDQEKQPLKVSLAQIKLSPSAPLEQEIFFEGNIDNLNNKHIIIVDDVANTGRTTFYASKPLMSILPASIEVCVLIDRKHKTFPIHADYVGLTLATSLQNEIRVHYGKNERVEIF